jgi:predicted kinase
VQSFPALVIVSGPPGTGKTTLAHSIAATVGCPAISRDEIKEGMVHATPGFTPSPGDELTTRTLSTFFGVLELLLTAGVTCVAEAAFRDRLWRSGLERLRELAEIRIVHCVLDPDIALQRTLQRRRDNPVRQAHADPGPEQARIGHNPFDRVSIEAPWIEVDTINGYEPDLETIVEFINDRR